MDELRPLRSFGSGIPVEAVLATRGDAANPLRLPPLEELAPYSIATAERAAGGPVEVRLWMHEGDAAAYLARRQADGAVTGAAVFAVLPSRVRASDRILSDL